MDTTRRPLLIVGLSTAFLIAACGGGPGAGAAGGGGPAATQAVGGGTPAADATKPSGGGPIGDACALLTDAQIEEVTGNPVTLREQEAGSGLLDDGCHWVLENPDSIVPPEIHLEVKFAGGRDYYERYFEPFNDENGYEPIAGLGDKAVDADFGSILVVSGDVLFDLQDLAFGDEKNHAEELAQRIVDNLGR